MRRWESWCQPSGGESRHCNAGPRTWDGPEGGDEVLKGAGGGHRFLNVFFLGPGDIYPVGMWPGWGRGGGWGCKRPAMGLSLSLLWRFSSSFLGWRAPLSGDIALLTWVLSSFLLFTLDPESPAAGIPQESPLLLPPPYPFPTPLLPPWGPQSFSLALNFFIPHTLPASAPCLVSQVVRMREGFEERGKAADTSSKIIYACKCLCGKASFVLEGHEGGV